MTEIIVTAKALAINPLKASQPIGASLAFLGLAEAMPLEHGARGCTSFNKLYFMRHFNEPIALQTTAMDQTTTVLGADDSVVEALATVCRRNGPQVIGLITTGLSEMQGADMPRTVKAFRAKHPEFAEVAVIPVAASDTLGCLETGFAAAVEAIVETLVPDTAWPGTRRAPRRRTQVNVLVGATLTPGDIDEIRTWIEAFGLDPIIVPDISDSLDGHMIERGYGTLTYGGVARERIAEMGASAATLVIGRSLAKAADRLEARTGVPDFRFDHLMGLAACDAFTETLAAIAERPVPASIRRTRARLEDAMVDCQFQIGGARAAIGADADQLAGLSMFLASLGVEIVGAVAANRSAVLADLPIETVVVGDLEDLEWLAKTGSADLVVTNSHGVDIAARVGATLMRAGFPIYDSFAANAETWVGYGGSRRTIFRLADLLAAQFQEIQPYRSPLRQPVPARTLAPVPTPTEEKTPC